MSEAAPNSNFTNEQETKKFVTAFAFGVHDSLLGMRLASPRRRLASILVDVLCVALLTRLSGLWFSALVVLVGFWVFYRLKGVEGKMWTKLALRIALTLSLTVMTIQVAVHFFITDEQIEAIFNKFTGVKVEVGGPEQLLEFQKKDLSNDYFLTVSELKAANGGAVCSIGLKCDNRFFDALIDDIAGKGHVYDEAKLIYQEVREFLDENDRLDVSMESSTLSKQLYQNRFEESHSLGAAKQSNSLIFWFSGFLGDLGLSFGWAALYFSVLTSSWSGQTVGKRLFAIKVVRIDGKTIDLWESLGRYGGYSAGFATGLLGFMQIYWDANRQAIQDKISETLVVKL